MIIIHLVQCQQNADFVKFFISHPRATVKSKKAILNTAKKAEHLH